MILVFDEEDPTSLFNENIIMEIFGFHYIASISMRGSSKIMYRSWIMVCVAVCIYTLTRLTPSNLEPFFAFRIVANPRECDVPVNQSISNIVLSIVQETSRKV